MLKKHDCVAAATMVLPSLKIAAKLEEQGFINFHRSIEISARMKSQRPGGSERDKDEQYLIHRARMHQGID